MRNFIIPITILFLMACGRQSTDSVAEDTQAVYAVFGADIDPEGAISVLEIYDFMADKDSAEVKVSGEILEVCQMKGCWMDMKIGDDEYMTVRFKDYAFFVPKDAGGYEAVIEGKLKKDVESVEWLRHKAEDAGKSQEEIDAITEPRVSFTFLASGVLIKDYKISEDYTVEE